MSFSYQTPKKIDLSPALAINCKRFQNFNFENFSTTEVVFFNWLVARSNSFKFPFYHSFEDIRHETGIKRFQLTGILKKFVSLGIVVLTKRRCKYSSGSITHFHVQFHNIIELIPKIYKFDTSTGLSETQYYAEISKTINDIWRNQAQY